MYIKLKQNYLYFLVPVVAFLPQLLMSLNSFSQVRFEEFVESVQAPFWLSQRQIISGLHVNVGWYFFLLLIYKIFGFSLYTGKISYLVMSFFSNFALFYLLRKFFDGKIAGLILLTITLSPTLLYMNATDLHWAGTFHILIIIFCLLYFLDFSKKLSFLIESILFMLIMTGWFFYQAFLFYIPSLLIFYFWKLKRVKKIWPHLWVAIAGCLLPLIFLFLYVDNKQLLILDPATGSGLFRGGGRFVLSEEIFTQAWTNLLPDFFVKGVSHHYEVKLAEFSLIFPILTLIFIFYFIHTIWIKVKKARKMIFLALLVIAIDLIVFSTTSDLGMPGMKRLTPLLVAIYFLWAVCWYYRDKFKVQSSKLKVMGMVILSLLTIHHLIVYPVNLSHIKDPSPFKVTDWFDRENPQKSVDEYVKLAQKQDLLLDCRPIVAGLGQCFYDFIYPAVAGSCSWNRYKCRNILGYDPKSGQFIPLTIKLWQQNYFEP